MDLKNVYPLLRRFYNHIRRISPECRENKHYSAVTIFEV